MIGASAVMSLPPMPGVGGGGRGTWGGMTEEESAAHQREGVAERRMLGM